MTIPLPEQPVPRALPWAGRRVLVTGGTSGTGLAVARGALQLGATVVVNGRDAGRTADTLSELRAQHGPDRAYLAVGDCLEHAQAVRVVADAVAVLGGLDVLVSAGASAAGYDPKPFASMRADEIAGGLTTRFLARVNPVHAAIPHLLTGERPAVVLLTTDAARHATRGESIVGAYAAGVVAFTKTVARELARDGVRVNAVAMTLTSGTRSWERIFGEDSYQKELFARAVERFPRGTAPSAEDVAESVLHLCSPTTGQVTGQTLSVNGGLSFGGW